ncbi:MAG: S41 family peptidase [Clostridia bacterium]|nr:S41 family peptidase [Clostridia bacterium]
MVLVLAVTGTAGAFADLLGVTELPAEAYDDAAVTGIRPVFPDGVTEVTSKAVPFYNNDTEAKSEFTLYFMNGADDLPFVNAENLTALMDAVYNGPMDLGNRYTTEVLGSALIIRRENDSFAIIDFTDNTIYFDDKNTFLAPAGITASMDISMHEQKSVSDAGSLLDMNVAYIRKGTGTTFHMDDYGIPMILKDNEGYIPLQTVSDLFLADCYVILLYNGESLICAANGAISDPENLPMAEEDLAMLGFGEEDTGASTLTEEDIAAFGLTEEDLAMLGLTDGATAISPEDGSEPAADPAAPAQLADGALNSVYYTGKAAVKSDALAQMTYNELCMVLDLYYGLKEEHKIDSFDQLFIQTGLINRLLNNDAAETYIGLAELTGILFRDQHSAPVAPSYMLGDRKVKNDIMEYLMLTLTSIQQMMKYQIPAMKYYPNGIPGYEEVGDTAYITFNTFTRSMTRLYRESEITNNSEDVPELLIYATQQIRREGSPIKNVVLDLSQNIGGMADTAVMTIAWFLDAPIITLEDTCSGTESTITYLFDGNMNGVFGEADDKVNSQEYTLYCLISPISFSCGNLVPAMCKASETVTIIGQRSGGGACAVLPLSTADGNMFAISGHLKISTVKNGIFYSVDEGVEPDFVISKPDHFYDREYLTEWIHQLP